MSAQGSPADRLRQLLAQDRLHVTPSCFDALSAKMVERAGFDLTFMSGFAVSAARLGMPDTGLISYGEILDTGRNVCDAVDIPVIGDADTGYGNEMNVRRTIDGFARAGFAAAMIEDQVAPKRCGHTRGKEVVGRDEAKRRLRAAVDAREAGADPALVRYYFGSREALLLEVTQQIALQAEVETRSEDLTPEAGLEDLIHRTFRFTRSARYMQRLMAEELSSVRSPEVREKLRKWQSMPVEAYQALLDADHDKQLTDFSPLFVHLAVIGISDFFHSGEEVVKMLVPEGTDLAALEQEYEAFVPKLLLDGLRRR